MMRNKKKIVTLLTAVAILSGGFATVGTLAACGNSGGESGAAAQPGATETTYVAHLGETYVLPEGAQSDTVKDSKGASVETALGRFTAVDREGYTVTLSSGEKKKIEVVDISAPVIVTSYSVRYVSVGDEIETPDVTVDDEYKTKDVSFTAGWYCDGEATEDTVFAAGRYEYRIEATDEAGNKAEKTVVCKVVDDVLRLDTVLSFDDECGEEQIVNHNGFNVEYTTEKRFNSEEGSLRLTFNGNDSREPGFTVMNPAISDISDYTSLYFSIYNDTDEQIMLYVNWSGDGYMLKPGVWNLVDVKDVSSLLVSPTELIDENMTLENINGMFFLFVAINDGKLNALPFGDLYISAVRGIKSLDPERVEDLLKGYGEQTYDSIEKANENYDYVSMLYDKLRPAQQANISEAYEEMALSHMSALIGFMSGDISQTNPSDLQSVIVELNKLSPELKAKVEGAATFEETYRRYYADKYGIALEEDKILYADSALIYEQTSLALNGSSGPKFTSSVDAETVYGNESASLRIDVKNQVAWELKITVDFPMIANIAGYTKVYFHVYNDLDAAACAAFIAYTSDGQYFPLQDRYYPVLKKGEWTEVAFYIEEQTSEEFLNNITGLEIYIIDSAWENHVYNGSLYFGSMYGFRALSAEEINERLAALPAKSELTETNYKEIEELYLQYSNLESSERDRVTNGDGLTELYSWVSLIKAGITPTEDRIVYAENGYAVNQIYAEFGSNSGAYVTTSFDTTVKHGDDEGSVRIAFENATAWELDVYLRNVPVLNIGKSTLSFYVYNDSEKDWKMGFWYPSAYSYYTTTLKRQAWSSVTINVDALFTESHSGALKGISDLTQLCMAIYNSWDNETYDGAFCFSSVELIRAETDPVTPEPPATETTELTAEEINTRIAALPQKSGLAETNYAEVELLYAQYGNLSAADKAKVTESAKLAELYGTVSLIKAGITPTEDRIVYTENGYAVNQIYAEFGSSSGATATTSFDTTMKYGADEGSVKIACQNVTAWQLDIHLKNLPTVNIGKNSVCVYVYNDTDHDWYMGYWYPSAYSYQKIVLTSKEWTKVTLSANLFAESHAGALTEISDLTQFCMTIYNTWDNETYDGAFYFSSVELIVSTNASASALSYGEVGNVISPAALPAYKGKETSTDL